MRKSNAGSSPPNNTAEVNMELRSRQSEPLPDIPSLTYPRHYATPVGGQVNYGYEITDNDEYEVPVNDEYEVPVNDEYEVPVYDEYEVPVNDEYEVPVNDKHEVPVNKGHTNITVVDEEDEEIYAEVEDTEL